MSKKVKLSALLAGAAIAPWLLALTGLPSTAQPLESAAKDEVFAVTSVINLPDSQKLGAFDIGFVDPELGLYLLADRTNASIDVADTSNNQLIHQFKPGFVGATGNSDTSGPNGVLVANGNQLWAGDGMSRVWVLDVTTGAVIKGPISTALSSTTPDPTRADELCHDDNDHIILVANDASDPH